MFYFFMLLCTFSTVAHFILKFPSGSISVYLRLSVHPKPLHLRALRLVLCCVYKPGGVCVPSGPQVPESLCVSSPTLSSPDGNQSAFDSSFLTVPPTSPRRHSVGEGDISLEQPSKERLWEVEKQCMQETLKKQKQQMVEDKKWLEKEEKLLDPIAQGDVKIPVTQEQESGETESKELPEKPAEVPVQQPPTAELDRSEDQVYHFVTELVKAVVQLKNDVNTLPSSQYVDVVKSVGLTLRSLSHSVEDILPTLHDSIRTEIEGTQKLLNKDMAELITKMRLAQQNAVTSLKEECKRQMLAAAHTLAVDSKNLLDAVDQARVRANLAKPATS